MDNDLISRSALIEWDNASAIREAVGNWGELDDKAKAAVLRYAQSLKRAIISAPAVDAVEVGNCKGCIWAMRKRPQKCSCCRRNPDMKDYYEERKDNDRNI